MVRVLESKLMPNVKQLTLANEVFHRLMQYGAQHEQATELVASAAFQVGFVRIAAGMARWSREPNGHNEMQMRLSDEQFDVLMLAPVDAAARSAVTCMDLCAAAAYRLTGADPTVAWPRVGCPAPAGKYQE
jgi:hypothetical protein